jgi:hypothetical protein
MPNFQKLMQYFTFWKKFHKKKNACVQILKSEYHFWSNRKLQCHTMCIHLLATSTFSESQLYQNGHSAISFICVVALSYEGKCFDNVILLRFGITRNLYYIVYWVKINHDTLSQARLWEIMHYIIIPSTVSIRMSLSKL